MKSGIYRNRRRITVDQRIFVEEDGFFFVNFRDFLLIFILVLFTSEEVM